MKINVLFLLGSLALLWYPTALPAALKKLLHSDPYARWPAHLKGLASLRANWFDFTRAAWGAFLLARAFSWSAENPPDRETIRMAVLSQGMILVIGVLAQTIRRIGPVLFIAPLFYVSGVILAFSDPLIGSVAVLMGWALGIAFKKPELVLFFSFLFLAAGIALTQPTLPGIVICAVAALPLVLMFLSGRSFVYLVKKIGV
jgi:hypothetical protein